MVILSSGYNMHIVNNSYENSWIPTIVKSVVKIQEWLCSVLSAILFKIKSKMKPSLEYNLYNIPVCHLYTTPINQS